MFVQEERRQSANIKLPIKAWLPPDICQAPMSHFDLLEAKKEKKNKLWASRQGYLRWSSRPALDWLLSGARIPDPSDGASLGGSSPRAHHTLLPATSTHTEYKIKLILWGATYTSRKKKKMILFLIIISMCVRGIGIVNLVIDFFCDFFGKNAYHTREHTHIQKLRPKADCNSWNIQIPILI